MAVELYKPRRACVLRQAIDELNIKTKNWKDLLSDEPIRRSDIVVLQDPLNTDKFNLNNFHHVKNSLRVDDDELERAKTDPRARLRRVNVETKEALKELDETYKGRERGDPRKRFFARSTLAAVLEGPTEEVEELPF